MVTGSLGSRIKHDCDVVLILSGGNALGAFEAGVYEVLHEHELEPNWIIGASISAINGALIAGSSPDRRLDILRSFWRLDDRDTGLLARHSLSDTFDVARRTAAVGWTMLAGRTDIFRPALISPSPWARGPGLFETEPLAATLDRLVNFNLLNESGCRFTATAVDLETGEDVVFDSHHERMGSLHIRASAALPVTFPPVKINGRWLVDGGLSANLPIDPFFTDPPSRPVLCIAVDVLPLRQHLPATLGEAAGRMQDLIFAAQSRRAISRWQDVYASRNDVSIAFVRLAYTEQGNEVAGKAMDFSAHTIRQRWSAGHLAAIKAVEQIDKTMLGVPGLKFLPAN
jgi:NTE family protein